MSQLLHYTGVVNVAAGTNYINHQMGAMPYSWRFESSSGDPIAFAARPDYANNLQNSRLVFESTDAYVNVRVFILSVQNTQQVLLPIL